MKKRIKEGFSSRLSDLVYAFPRIKVIKEVKKDQKFLKNHD